MADKFIAKKGKSRQELKPGQWIKDSQGQVWLMCPHDHHNGTGHLSIIYGRKDGEDWDISAGGTVTPSVHVVMPDCGWHVFAHLEGWGG